mmetsp:Transcript_4782/g.12354  ORF Transcript_4782/g.12354 Transcript_4782/m.12354 type:complete len:186 (+) Transcript_4782:25-582(+)
MGRSSSSLLLGLAVVVSWGFQLDVAPLRGSRWRQQQTSCLDASPGKRRKRRKSAPAANTTQQLVVDEPLMPVNTTQQLIVDEPGKLVGSRLDDLRPKKPAKSDDPLDGLKRDISLLGGKRPDDPTDAFDYGVGGLIKQTVFILSAALIVFDLYLNSPFFERAAPPPLVTAVTDELAKTAVPAEGN